MVHVAVARTKKKWHTHSRRYLLVLPFLTFNIIKQSWAMSLKCFSVARLCAFFKRRCRVFAHVSQNKIRAFLVSRHHPSRLYFYFACFSRPHIFWVLVPGHPSGFQDRRCKTYVYFMTVPRKTASIPDQQRRRSHQP